MEYERLEEGKIKVVNNFRFEDGSLDHAWNRGRLCLVIFSDDEYEYVLPIRSKVKNKNYIYDNYYINENSILYYYDNIYLENTIRPNKNCINANKSMRNFKKQKKYVEGYINLQNIYKIPITFANDICKLKLDTYKSIVNKLYTVKNEKDNSVLKENSIKLK